MSYLAGPSTDDRPFKLVRNGVLHGPDQRIFDRLLDRSGLVDVAVQAARARCALHHHVDDTPMNTTDDSEVWT
jgi:hypothetical protein